MHSIDVVLDEARRKLDCQLQQLDGLDTKSGVNLGVAGVIFTLLVTSLLGNRDGVGNPLLVQVALVPILASLILSFISISIREYERPPKLERLKGHYIDKDVEETKRSIIDVTIDAVETNEERIKKKVWLTEYSYIVLGIGLGMVVVWAFSILWLY